MATNLTKQWHLRTINHSRAWLGFELEAPSRACFASKEVLTHGCGVFSIPITKANTNQQAKALEIPNNIFCSLTLLSDMGFFFLMCSLGNFRKKHILFISVTQFKIGICTENKLFSPRCKWTHSTAWHLLCAGASAQTGKTRITLGGK